MNKIKAQQLGRAAMEHISATDPEALAWARAIGPETFRNLRFKRFLADYCWVVYASGFSFERLKPFEPRLRQAFKDFEPSALARMRSVKPVLRVFRNERKATCFLKGAHALIDEGFTAFKRRLRQGGVDVLMELPGIAGITKNHLARNIGLKDTAKADIWLERAAKLCDTDVVSLSAYLAEKLDETQGTIDLAIWALGKDKRFKL